VAGDEYKKAVQNLVEMGFPNDQVVAAMRAAFNNPDRAVEYLMNGIPTSAGAAGAPQPPANQSVAAEATAMDAEGDEEDLEMSEMVDAFESLRQIPQFDQIRQMILSQPQLLEPMLAQLAQSHPELLQVIAQNPQAFMAWLTMAGGDVPGSNVIRLTEDENSAVERLVALGFDKNMAVQAYLACDKNEMLAANYLFDTANDDMDA
jgi:UV excision repair protein RAD23